MPYAGDADHDRPRHAVCPGGGDGGAEAEIVLIRIDIVDPYHLYDMLRYIQGGRFSNTHRAPPRRAARAGRPTACPPGRSARGTPGDSQRLHRRDRSAAITSIFSARSSPGFTAIANGIGSAWHITKSWKRNIAARGRFREHLKRCRQPARTSRSSSTRSRGTAAIRSAPSARCREASMIRAKARSGSSRSATRAGKPGSAPIRASPAIRP